MFVQPLLVNKRIQEDGTHVFFGSGYVTIYANEEAYANKKNILEGSSVVFDIDMASEKNIIEQAYDALKAQNIIINGVDC